MVATRLIGCSDCDELDGAYKPHEAVILLGYRVGEPEYFCRKHLIQRLRDDELALYAVEREEIPEDY